MSRASGKVDLEAGSAKKPAKKRKYDARDPAAFEASIREVEERIALDVRKRPEAWGEADADTLLGIYAFLHARVYGVDARDLSDEWKTARAHVRRFVEREFDGDYRSGVDFARWACKRDFRPDGERRVQWRWVFRTSKAVDFRMWRARLASG